MHFKKYSWTLVRYAGPASKASIGSKPIGSELGFPIPMQSTKVNDDVDHAARAWRPRKSVVQLARLAR